jgi:hypothetical protein
VVEETYLGFGAIETQSLVKRGNLLWGEIDLGQIAKKLPVLYSNYRCGALQVYP